MAKLLSQGEMEDIQLGLANLILIEKKKDLEIRERIDYLKKLIKKVEKISKEEKIKLEELFKEFR